MRYNSQQGFGGGGGGNRPNNRHNYGGGGNNQSQVVQYDPQKQDIDNAELIMKSIAKSLTTSQIRNILSMTAKIYDRVNSGKGWEDLESDINALRIQLVYQSGRNPAVKKLVDNAKLADKLKDITAQNFRTELLKYCQYMEALVAYGKYYGMKEN